MTSPSDADEARAILELCEGNALRAFTLVQDQLGTIVLRTQVMLSLSGIVITVTGFSGKSIATTSALARLTVVAGLCLVLAAAAVAVIGVLRLHWLTQYLQPRPLETLLQGLRLRNDKTRYLRIAQSLFVVGFSLYCFAVAQLLLAH